MLDIKLIRENPDLVKAAMKSRNKDMDALVDEVLAIDVERRELMQVTDAMKQEQNAASKQIPQIKKAGGDISEIMARMNEIKEKVKANDAAIAELDKKQKTIMYEFPNVPNSSVPLGKDDSENVEIRRYGEPRNFDFEPKAHWDIGADLGILDPETAAKVTGTRFHFYKGLECVESKFGIKLGQAKTLCGGVHTQDILHRAEELNFTRGCSVSLKSFKTFLGIVENKC